MNTNKHELKDNVIVYQIIGYAIEVINKLGHARERRDFRKSFIVKLKSNNFLKHSKLE